MNATELANVLSGIFAELPKSYDEVRYALEGDAKFKPPASVVRKVLTDFARETGKGSSSFAIAKAFDQDAEFVVDLAVTCAASFAKKPH
jgi:hypothetical protein